MAGSLGESLPFDALLRIAAARLGHAFDHMVFRMRTRFLNRG